MGCRCLCIVWPLQLVSFSRCICFGLGRVIRKSRARKFAVTNFFCLSLSLVCNCCLSGKDAPIGRIPVVMGFFLSPVSGFLSDFSRKRISLLFPLSLCVRLRPWFLRSFMLHLLTAILISPHPPLLPQTLSQVYYIRELRQGVFPLPIRRNDLSGSLPGDVVFLVGMWRNLKCKEKSQCGGISLVSVGVEKLEFLIFLILVYV